MPSSTLTTALMTSVSAALPTKNYEYAAKLPLRSTAGSECYGYIYFSKPFPAKAIITSAKLYLYTEAIAQTGSLTLSVRRLKQSVSMTKVTFNTRPTSIYSEPAITLTKTGPQAANAEWSIDVTSFMQSVANGDPWYGFQLLSNFSPVDYVYGPKWTTSTYRPKLVVTWTTLPEAPTSLAPGGGRAVGFGRPVVKAVYSEAGGDGSISAVNVQRSASTDFTTPVWDSGTVAATAPELDLSTTSFVTLADGETVFWRMRIQDVNGLWSPWSLPESFKRDDQGTLTINSPAASPNNVVNDPTAPVSWTLTGETQAAYEVIIGDPTSATVADTIWTSGKVTSTATGITLPANVLKETGKTYRITVFVWDAKQREAVPNWPTYVSAARDFTFVLSNTTAPVTTLTATPDPVRPRVTLNFSRSAFPDTFTVLRDGKVIATDLIPNDLFVSGTSFQWVDPAPVGGATAVTYEVAAVVNSKASSGNAQATTTAASMGIWLSNRDRTHEVVLYGREARQHVLGETSEAFDVLGGTEVAVVTHSQRLLEGSVSGQLVGGVLGLSNAAAQWRAELMEIRSNPGALCWLTLNDATIPVVIRNVTCSARPVPTLIYDVSFEFYQQDLS